MKDKQISVFWEIGRLDELSGSSFLGKVFEESNLMTHNRTEKSTSIIESIEIKLYI